MFNLYKRLIKYTWCNVRTLKQIHSYSFRYHPSRIYPCQVSFVRHTGSKHTFNIKNTSIELKKKFDRLSMKLENGFPVSLHSIDNILTHPCIDACRISKADSLNLLASCEFLHEETREKSAEYVWRIWEKLKKIGMIDLDTYHSLLKALRETGTHVEAKNILNSLLLDGFSPTAETYTLLLECVCENQNFEDMEYVLSTSKEAGYEIADKGLNAILFATVKSRGLNSAMEYLNSSGKGMNSEIYTSLLRGVATNRDSDCFNRLFTEARNKNVEFSIRNRVLIVQTLIEKEMNSVILNVLGGRNEWRTYPTTLYCLITRCLCVKNYKAMHEILEFMGNLIHAFTRGTNELPPCSYLELIITTMVRSKMPLDNILQFCSEGDSASRLKTAAYSSLRNRLFDYSIALFKAMKSIDLPLRPHYFWPLFVSSRTDQDIFNVLTNMHQLGVELDYDTLFKYVIKRLNPGSLDMLEILKKFEIPLKTALTPYVAVCLQRKHFSPAIELCRKYKSEVEYEKLYFVIASSSLANQHFDSVLQICLDDDNHLLKVFHNLIFNFKNEAKPYFINNFLNRFKQNGISIFKADLNELRAYTSLHCLNEEWLDGLVNETNMDASSARPHLRDMKIDELEDYIVNLRANNYPLRQALRRLLIMHAEKGNVDRVMQLKEELEAKGMYFSLGMKIAILKTFCLNDNFNQAYDMFLEMKSNGSHEKLQGTKFLLLAGTAAKKGNLEVVYEILKSRTNCLEDNLTKDCVRLMSTVTDYYGVSAADQLLEFLVRNNYCKVKVMLLGPIIKYYLARDEVENASLACLKYANRYRLMPMKKNIIRKLAVLTVQEQTLKSEPKYQPLLNKMLQTAGYLYGSSHSNLVYILCLAETGLLATLRLYLKESCTGVEDKLLWHECNKLSDNNEERTLVNLEKVFKDLHFNAEPIYINLLKIYSRNNDVSSAHNLLISLEESKRMPSVEFLNMLAELQNGDNVG